jgi:hypothetical protein
LTFLRYFCSTSILGFHFDFFQKILFYNSCQTSQRSRRCWLIYWRLWRFSAVTQRVFRCLNIWRFANYFYVTRIYYFWGIVGSYCNPQWYNSLTGEEALKWWIYNTNVSLLGRYVNETWIFRIPDFYSSLIYNSEQLWSSKYPNSSPFA